MNGSSFGKCFRITTWGESHGPALGVVVDGCPAGLELTEEDIQKYLDLRKPGTSSVTTQRKEEDRVHILSGVFQGKTTGTPISMLIQNTSQHSADYGNIAYTYRPGHADYTFDAKYGFRDYRGGGRSSGRETAARVAAGAIAIKILQNLGIEIISYTKSIRDITIDRNHFDVNEITQNAVCMPDKIAAEQAQKLIEECRMKKDSVGGVAECRVTGLMAGLGDPVFDKLDARLGQALFSIGAVKAVEIGDGVSVTKYYGSENNDPFTIRDDKVVVENNRAGGILGGISSGADIILRAHFKPTPSIYQPQNTVTNSGEETVLEIKGRHDPCVVPRAIIVVKAMTAITILDALLDNIGTKMEHLQKIYQ